VTSPADIILGPIAINTLTYLSKANVVKLFGVNYAKIGNFELRHANISENCDKKVLYHRPLGLYHKTFCDRNYVAWQACAFFTHFLV